MESAGSDRRVGTACEDQAMTESQDRPAERHGTDQHPFLARTASGA